MTQNQRQTASNWIAGAKDWAGVITVAIALIYLGGQAITTLAGPIKMGNQVDLASITGRVTALEEAQKSLIASQAATVNEIRDAKASILDKINSLPRSTDYFDQSTHLTKLDDRMNKVESDENGLSAKIGGVDTRLSNLEGRQPYRNPTGGH